MFGTAIKINGKTYQLKLRVNEVIKLKAEGIDVMKMDDGLEFDFELLRTLFFHALQLYHKKEVTSIEKAGDLMSDYLDDEVDGDFQELAKVIMLTVSKSFGAKKAKEAERVFDKAIADAEEGKL